MGMIALPWSVVTALKLEPVGPIAPAVFGLRYKCLGWDEDREDGMWQFAQCYEVAEPRRLSQLRDALGCRVDSPTGLRRPDKTPFYQALCSVHRALTED